MNHFILIEFHFYADSAQSKANRMRNAVKNGGSSRMSDVVNSAVSLQRQQNGALHANGSATNAAAPQSNGDAVASGEQTPSRKLTRTTTPQSDDSVGQKSQRTTVSTIDSQGSIEDDTAAQIAAVPSQPPPYQQYANSTANPAGESEEPNTEVNCSVYNRYLVRYLDLPYCIVYPHHELRCK